MACFNRLKALFKSSPKYHIYQPNQLKIIAMQTRMALEEIQKKLALIIQKQDNHFFSVMSIKGQNPRISYTILQQLSQKILEIESVIVLIQLCRKIQTYSGQIVRTNGDISQLRNEIKWFQCILWYRNNRSSQGLDQIHEFCYNFFHGTDVVIPINTNSDLFELYPVLKYLGNQYADPTKYNMWEVYYYVKSYIKATPEEIQDLVSFGDYEEQQQKKQKGNNLQTY